MEFDTAGYDLWSHRLAKLVAAATFMLIFIGGLVTSTGSGLSVPDWPNTFGQFMFSYPAAKMVGGVFYEHGHRMIATIVGMLMTALAIWLWFKESRIWVKWLGLAGLLAVILQGVLGGITVLYHLPTIVSVLHGCLAQGFFVITVALAMFTSKDWLSSTRRIEDTGHRPRLTTLAFLTTGVVYLQLILGALMRHTGAGLAIPDFPLAFGRLIPEFTTPAITIHFMHRVGAVTVTLFVLSVAFRIFKHYYTEEKLMRPLTLLLGALTLQFFLAAFTIWSKKAVIPTTAHVATGALILAISSFLSLRAYQLTRTIKQSS